MDKWSKEDIKFFKQMIFLIVLLTLSLIYLNLNKSISYNKYERVKFKSSGVNLYANLYYPSKTISFQDQRPLIIYCHGIASQRDFDLRIPIELTKRGFFVAALDYQGHGESGGNIINIDPNTNIPALAEDCSNLLDKLETLPFYSEVNTSQIGLIGHSLGGMVVLMNQALDPRFNVTVAWAPLVNFDPEELGIIQTEEYNKYIPVNLLNETNTNNLLIIMHINDEALNYSNQALKAQELTNCSLITITKPLFGGGHALISNIVLKDSIKWFESYFFNSETINGPIKITFLINYFSIFITMGLMFIIVLLLISYSYKFFIPKKEPNISSIQNEKHNISKHKTVFQIGEIILYSVIFIINWEIFERVFGLPGLFFGSLNIAVIYAIVQLLGIFKKYEKEKGEFNLKQFFKSQIRIKTLILLLIFSIYFISVYFIFAFTPSDPIQLYIIPVSLIMIILGSITITLTIIGFRIYLKRPKDEREKFHIKEIISKPSTKIKYFIYSSLCSFYFIITYMIFTFFYPFAFMWPSNYLNLIIGSATAFPIYFSLELFYRKVVYPRLNFLKTERQKSYVIVVLATVIQINLMILTWSWAFFASVIFTYLIFLIVIIQNTLIFEHTNSFGSVVLSSFEIIQIFFSAVVSNAIGIGAALHFVLNL
ncbi:MAG: alpha/beta hydrolase [Candidatus Thorarchaeota archaeon]